MYYTLFTLFFNEINKWTDCIGVIELTSIDDISSNISFIDEGNLFELIFSFSLFNLLSKSFGIDNESLLWLINILYILKII